MHLDGITARCHFVCLDDVTAYCHVVHTLTASSPGSCREALPWESEEQAMRGHAVRTFLTKDKGHIYEVTGQDRT